MSASILNGISATVSGSVTEGSVTVSTEQSESGAEFASSLNAQVQEQEEGLQAIEKITPLASESETVLNKIADLLSAQDRQSVAALLGKSLPSLPKNSQIQEIDLDETMAALQDILGSLDAVKMADGVEAQNLIDAELSSVVDKPIEPKLVVDADIASQLGINVPVETPNKVSVTQDQLDFLSDGNDTVDAMDAASLISTLKQNTLTPASPDVVNIQPLAGNASAVLPQALKQEQARLEKMPIIQTAVIEGESNDGLDSGSIMRENLLKLGSRTAETATVIDNIAAKSSDLPATTSSLLAEQANQKFSSADLSMLARQVENATPKQELPAMTKAFNSPEWKQEFNERIVWMQNKAIPSAELRLNPQHLGSISIQINMDKDQQASILFNANNAGVREAIDAALPKLRDMLGAQQVTLAEASVAQQGQDQGSARQAMQDALQDRKQNNSAPSLAAESEEAEINPMVAEITQGRAVSSKGLLSLYA